MAHVDATVGKEADILHIVPQLELIAEQLSENTDGC